MFLRFIVFSHWKKLNIAVNPSSKSGETLEDVLKVYKSQCSAEVKSFV